MRSSFIGQIKLSSQINTPLYSFKVKYSTKDNFAGSAIDMKSSYTNLIEKVGLTIEESRQLTYSNPSKVFNRNF